MLTIPEVFLVFIFVEHGSIDGNIILILPASLVPVEYVSTEMRFATVAHS